MTKIFVSAVIDAPIDKVWDTVRDFNGMPDWHPRFSRSHIEDGRPSDAIGCIRNFDIVDGGGTIREKLLMLDDANHCFEYCILDSPLPVNDYGPLWTPMETTRKRFVISRSPVRVRPSAPAKPLRIRRLRAALRAVLGRGKGS